MSIREAYKFEEWCFIKVFSWWDEYGYIDNGRIKRWSLNTFYTLKIPCPSPQSFYFSLFPFLPPLPQSLMKYPLIYIFITWRQRNWLQCNIFGFVHISILLVHFPHSDVQCTVRNRDLVFEKKGRSKAEDLEEIIV